MEEILNNPSSIWFLIGFIALIVEAFILGLSSGLLLFGGLAALVTGLLFSLGVLEGSAFALAPLATTGVLTGILAVLLWKPLKALQNRKGDMYQENNSDFVGLKLTLEMDLSLKNPGTVSYSGINWKVEIEPEFEEVVPAGDMVEVTRVRVGGFTVKPVSIAQ